MDITISKSDFEAALPVGQSAHETVFETLEPVISTQLTLMEKDILGDEGVAMVEAAEESSTLVQEVKRLACLSAFVASLRQLDLKLTPTGFGVISTDSYAPASQARVDALDASLKTARIKSEAMLLDLLRSESWGVTKQAARKLPCIYTAYDFFYFSPEQDALTYQDWQKAAPLVEDADRILRRKIGNAQMDIVAEAFRCDADDDYIGLIARIRSFSREVVVNGGRMAIATTLPYVFQTLEDDLEKYSAWAESKEYIAFHEERFQNTKDATGFIFA